MFDFTPEEAAKALSITAELADTDPNWRKFVGKKGAVSTMLGLCAGFTVIAPEQWGPIAAALYDKSEAAHDEDRGIAQLDYVLTRLIKELR